MDEPEEIDLSALALGLAFRSVGYVVLACFAAVSVFLVGKIAGFDRFTNNHIWMLAAVFWCLLEFDIARRIRRIAAMAPAIRSNTRSLHGLEFSVVAFLILYSIARPYLIDSDASAFPAVKVMFEVFIGILALCHCLVLALFRKKPDRWDAVALAGAVVAAIVGTL